MTRTIVGTVMAFLTLVPGIAQAQTEQVFYYHTDAIGSVRMITDSTGQVVARYDYLPFGEPCGSACGTPSLPDRRQFVGKERDQESGLDYFGARYYRDQIGRFTTVDPVVDQQKALLDPQRWNRYAYALNNPLKFIDPDGREPAITTRQLDFELPKWAYLAFGLSTLGGATAIAGPTGWRVAVGCFLSPSCQSTTMGVTEDLLGAPKGSFTSAEIGAAREVAVATLTGGKLAGEAGVGMSVTVKGLGTTGVDVIGSAGEYIGVGGPAKALNLADFGRKLQILRAAAEQAGVKAQYAFAKGTPRSIIDFAKKRLGDENVFEFEP